MPGNLHAISCPRCAAAWSSDPTELGGTQWCPNCRVPVRIEVFPSWSQDAAPGATAQAAVEAGESVCYFHTHKLAIIPCDQCGRFLCALCDVELEGRHYCPNCLQLGAQKGAIAALERNRTRWDIVVWWLLLAPLLFCGGVPLPITAPGALILSLIKRKALPSLVARSRAWLTAGSVVAVLEFVLGIVIWIGMTS